MAFENCAKLISVTVLNSVESIGEFTFQECTNLEAAYFAGNAPLIDSSVFFADTNATAYYLELVPKGRVLK
jgi:hypothetical protein